MPLLENVSRIALGTVALGLDYGAPGSNIQRPDFKSAEQLLNGALDYGVNLIDTARAYGDSEEIIRKAIGHRRSEFILASKVVPSPGDPTSTRQSVEQSLRALNVDMIDIIQIHCRPDDRAPDEATTQALLELQRQGRIRHLGASVYGEETALAAIGMGCFDILQVAYSVLDRRPEKEVLSAAQQKGVRVLARSVLLKGVLSDRYRTLPPSLAALRQCVESLLEVAGFSSERLPELAYRYVLSESSLDFALSGATSLRELEETLQWVTAGPLSAEIVSKIRGSEAPAESILNPANWN